MSITPAFSPGPQITQGALVGSFFRWMRERFVGAMLRPHDREDAELGEVRLAAERVQDALIFLGGQAVLGDDFGVMRAASRTVMARH